MSMLADVRYGFRLLRKSPLFTLAAIVTLALGIGVNSAIYSAARSILLKTVPFSEAENLYWITEASESFGEMSVSYANFRDWHERQRVFEHLVAHRYQAFGLHHSGGYPETTLAVQATHELLDVLDVRPALGRFFSAEDDQAGAAKTVLLGHGIWQRRFGGSEEILGTTIELDRESYEVIGVLPRDFLYPFEDRRAELWLPLGLFIDEHYLQRGNHPGITVTGRALDGIGSEQVLADLNRIAAELADEYPDTNTNSSVLAVQLRQEVVENVGFLLLALSVAVALVLLIACVNVANLLLARNTERRQEMAVRAALGASSRRLARQMLVECMLLGTLGGFASLGIGWAVLKVFESNLQDLSYAAFGAFRMDFTTLLFTFLVSLGTGLLFGLLPAFQVRRESFVEELKEGAKGSEGRNAMKARSLLVVAESAIALILLVGAMLFLRSLDEILKGDPGVRFENVLTFRLDLPEAVYPEEEQQRLFYQQLRERLASLPGVLEASYTFPLLGGWQSSFEVEGREPSPPGQGHHTEVLCVSPEYFSLMGMRLVAGDLFTDADRADTRSVAVIDQLFANRMFPGEDPIGRRITFDDPEGPPEEIQWIEILGVVNHVKNKGMHEDARIQFYRPFAQVTHSRATLTLRAADDPKALVGSVRRAIADFDPMLPASSWETLEEYFDQRYVSQRLVAGLLSGFAILALALAIVGIYGVISWSVTQRRREIGIRLALGASASQIVSLIVWQGIRWVLLGTALGLGIVFFLAPLVQSQLYLVEPRDPTTLLVLPLALNLVALLACTIPAQRVSLVEPVWALRYE